ncbi:MAG: hypothetical protein QN178_03520 [Armatimonadota bacterium]|nr:hypothetical protein [Armatimonadota bacterium]
MNPVARGDLVVRLTSARGLRAQTVYLAVCSAFLLLSLPPEIGRLDLRDANLLLAVLAVQIVAVTYLSSAMASSELAIEGEKGLPDLALSAFSPGVIALGKMLSSALYAGYLLAIGLPIFMLGAALRGAPLAPIAWTTFLSLAVATSAGVWGAWFGGRFASDFTRSVMHWLFLGIILGGTALLPETWWPANPFRATIVLIRDGWTPWWLATAAVYLGLAGVGTVLVGRFITFARSHEGGV